MSENMNKRELSLDEMDKVSGGGCCNAQDIKTDEDLYDYVYNFIGTLEKTWSKDIAMDILIGQFPSYDAKMVYINQGLDGLFNFLGQKFIDGQGTH